MKKPEEVKVSPRRQLYEAKFDNYKTNKELKDVKQIKREALKKEDFDRHTKNEHSPSKQTYRYSQKKPKKSATLYTEEDEMLLLSPEIVQEEKRQRDLGRRQASKGDDFQKLGVGNEDKMLYFLLKWIFNAIKIETTEDDPVLKGHPYVRKIDLVKQLQKNADLVSTLGFNHVKDVKELVKLAPCKKENSFIWDEFCDFFFLKEKVMSARLDTSAHWWRKIDAPEEEGEKNPEAP